MAAAVTAVLACLAGIFWWIWLAGPEGEDPNIFVWSTAWLLTLAAFVALLIAGVMHLRRRRESRR